MPLGTALGSRLRRVRLVDERARHPLPQAHTTSPSEWGTAVTVQAMVFGNMGANSATGVAFSRDAATGENIFNGEYLINAQGEDVVAGIRTPQQITIEGSKRWAVAQNVSEEERGARNTLRSKRSCPPVYKELDEIQRRTWSSTSRTCRTSSSRFRTASCGCSRRRNGKRTGAAMVKIAMDMLARGSDRLRRTAVLRMRAGQTRRAAAPRIRQ